MDEACGRRRLVVIDSYPDNLPTAGSRYRVHLHYHHTETKKKKNRKLELRSEAGYINWKSCTPHCTALHCTASPSHTLHTLPCLLPVTRRQPKRPRNNPLLCILFTITIAIACLTCFLLRAIPESRISHSSICRLQTWSSHPVTASLRLRQHESTCFSLPVCAMLFSTAGSLLDKRRP